MDPSLVTVVVGTISSVVALLTLMFNARTARKREERAREWQLEDRAAQALSQDWSMKKTAELTEAIADVRAKTVASTKAQHATREILTTAIAQVQQKTEEGITASKGAQDVANHARERLEQLGLRVAALTPKPQERRDGA